MCSGAGAGESDCMSEIRLSASGRWRTGGIMADSMTIEVMGEEVLGWGERDHP